jgi:16S rRNA (guanine527-N7)-methyltransferase
MDAVEFWTICSSNGIILTPEQMDNVVRFHNELLIWNKRVNLISRQDMENIYERHILHSLTILKYATIPPKARCMDVGTGGGFPGIPLKIALPELRLLLVDSIAKKLKTAAMLGQHTGLRYVEAKTLRAESLADEAEYRKSFDVITARAVAPLVQLVSWVKPLVKPSGQLLFLKGGDLAEEISEARKKYPSLLVEETAIDLRGAAWFKEQEKKLLVCTFDPSIVDDDPPLPEPKAEKTHVAVKGQSQKPSTTQAASARTSKPASKPTSKPTSKLTSKQRPAGKPFGTTFGSKQSSRFQGGRTTKRGGGNTRRSS